MKRTVFSAFVICVLLLGMLPATAGAAGSPKSSVSLPIAVDIDPRLKDMPAPAQKHLAAEAASTAGQATQAVPCFGSGETLTITIPSFDPANPGMQDVVFYKETAEGEGGMATLWVAWDFLNTAYGRQDTISCDQLATLQASMDKIVATDVKYFGAYKERPAGNPNIDVMIYNIVDESYFDPAYPFYIAGFFWSSLNEFFDRNMIFVDSYDWANRLGPGVLHPYLYEGTVAHELEHLIHSDHDPDEDSWVDEGLADLAEYLNGFGHPDSHVVYYLAYHRTPLTTWGGGLESYGASYLFQLYLLENYGTKDADGSWNPTWTRKLVNEQANSIAGIETATGAHFNDLFDAWILANYLDKPDLPGPAGLPLGYKEISLTPFTTPAYGSWSIEQAVKDIYGGNHHGNLPVSRYYGGYVSGTVEYPIGALPPYAPAYGTFKGMQPAMNISLRADAQSGVAPAEGSYEMASGGGNLLKDRILVLNVPVGGTLTFKTWFDIEEEWDYGFVEVSKDNGSTWTPIPGSITRTSTNPNLSTAWANSLVAGQASTDAAITGSSGGWVDATFELPADSNVLVRFAYYTDEATNGQGWYIDDVKATGGSFSDGFESGPGKWTLGGWSWTTGLFNNDWAAAYVVPTYKDGKFDHISWGTLDQDLIQGKYEIEQGTVNTGMLQNDQAMVVIANRPGEMPFASGYRLLVSKVPASR